MSALDARRSRWICAALAPSNTLDGRLGASITGIGVAFAIWARYRLGRNWAHLKEDRVLLTTGPYAYVRQPIYADAILALLGSALASARQAGGCYVRGLAGVFMPTIQTQASIHR